MVTRALPATASSDATLLEIYEAVGSSFLTRLLLPLRSPSRAPTSNESPIPTSETVQKQAGTAVLGLAILSSIAHVAEIAASIEFLELLPLFLSVVRAGGVSSLIAAHSRGVAAPEVDAATEASAVHDALQCSVAAAHSGPEGRQIAEESGALFAAVAAFQQAAASDIEDDEDAGAIFQQQLWAVRLVAALLSAPERAVIIGRNCDAVQALIPHIAHAFALPAVLTDDSLKRKSAVLHLEALHTALLLLPLPIPEAFTAHNKLSRAALHSVWAHEMRLGIAAVLQSRIGAVQRHGALQLAAALVALAGPSWLLNPLVSSINTRSTNSKLDSEEEEGARFYQLIVEILRIETNVLLHDALTPTAHVPHSAVPGTAAADWKLPPQFHQHRDENGDDEDLDMDVDDQEDDEEREQKEQEKSGESYKSTEGTHQKEEEKDEQQQQQQGNSENSVEEVYAVPVKDSSFRCWSDGGPSETAGERALRVLPSCFSLVESAIDVLAEDAEREVSGGGGRGRLSPSVAERALHSLQEVVEILLQVLEEDVAVEKQVFSVEDDVDDDVDGLFDQKDHLGGGKDVPSTSTSISNALKVGAVRVLGRFLAEVPDAFEDRVRPLLSHILSVRASSSVTSTTINSSKIDKVTIDELRNRGGSSGGSQSHLTTAPTLAARDLRNMSRFSVDSLLDPLGQSNEHMGVGGDGYDEGDYVLGMFHLAEGVTFFLPLLLQVTDPGRVDGQHPDSHQKWLETIILGGSLQHIVDYAIVAAEDRGKTVTEGSALAADEVLCAVCRVLLQILMHILEEEEVVVTTTATIPKDAFSNDSSGEVQKERRDQKESLSFCVADATWPLISSLSDVVEVLLSSAAGEVVSTEDEVSVTSCCTALLAAVLDSIAAEADHPDAAHRGQQQLFKRAGASSSGGNHHERRVGLGPLGGEDLDQACDVIMRSMQFLRHSVTSTAENLKLMQGMHGGGGGGDAAVVQEVQEDYTVLVGCVRRLLGGCGAFREAVDGCKWLQELIKGEGGEHH